MASSRTVRVTSVLSEPYVMNATDGSGFKGFVVDLLDEIAKRVRFKYQIHLAADGRYGSMDSKTGEWDGMIGELVRREADLAAADLTITSDRDRVVEFTRPYLTQTYRLLVRSPPLRPAPSLGIALEPFSVELWLCICIALLIVSVLFMIIGRFNPYEWRQVPADKDPRGARHSFGLRESLMFVFSTLTLQGYRETPRSLAGRVLTVSWFIFIILTVIAYISNVIAFNMPRPGSDVIPMPFDGLDDLSKQTEVKLLTLKEGSSFNKLKTSSQEVYRRLFNRMESDPTMLVKTTAEGIERVQNSGGRYVMLLESLKGDYIAQQKCDLMMYGSGHFPTGLGFATPIRSDLRVGITMAILELLEDGTIHQLQRRWWLTHGRCPVKRRAAKVDYPFRVTQMTVKNMVAPFLILLVGAILSVIIFVGEVVFKKLRK